MKKFIYLFVICVILLTVFGPWNTYRQEKGGAVDGAKVVYVQDMPAWIAWSISLFSPLETQQGCDNPFNPFD